MLTNVGLLYLRTHSEDQAFSILGKALSYDPTHAPSILAAGSIIQANGDYDVALAKYRLPFAGRENFLRFLIRSN